MNNEIRKNLIDILQAAEEIQKFTHNIEFNEYTESQITQRAVERDFEIIGEALVRIRKIDEDFIDNISEHHRIIGFRNILVHGYDVIDEKIVWNAIKNHLPLLINEINSLLNTK